VAKNDAMSKKNKSGNPVKSGKAELKLNSVKTSIKELFAAEQGVAFTVSQIIKKLGIRDKISKDMIPDVLFTLERQGKIKQQRNSFISLQNDDDIIGTIDHVNPKFGYIVVPGMENDIWVKTEDLRGGIDGDQVRVTLKSGRSGARPEGKVVEVISRSKTEFVGRVQLSAKFAFVIPDSRKIYNDFFVYPEKTKNARDNDKVIVRVKDWGGRDKSPTAEVIDILGAAGENEAEIHSIMAEFGLPFSFEESVEKAAADISEVISESEIKKRRDFRDITTFTIDPADAKDFDDALSLKTLQNGNYEIGVHIADVTHYVVPDTILEEEAYNRATSVYLVDRTIPMLPEKLSNNLCSLRPNEDKLTFSAVFEITPQAKVVNEWFGRTVIHSDRRFTYEEAQERIETGEGDFVDEINLLNGLAHQLKKARFDNGAINFETVEVKFKLDEKGKPLGVITKVRKDAHKLIEEFMLLANKKVAESINKKKGGAERVFVYRTHDNPDPEKLENFAGFAVRFGHKLQFDRGSVSGQLNQLMSDIEGKPEQNVLESLAIRSMAKAKYTTDPKGHFGLAFDYYSHFTSPIRRYPDMMVHRLLQHHLDSDKPLNKEKYEEQCVHASEREKRAAEAERASIKFKQVEFMSSVLGQSFNGIVTGVTEWGVFVEITETKCEGMVRITDIDDDHYEFDEKNYRIVGRNNKKMISLGDKTRVKIIRTDINRRTIDLEFSTE
jgi:ribonuclease R